MAKKETKACLINLYDDGDGLVQGDVWDAADWPVGGECSGGTVVEHLCEAVISSEDAANRRLLTQLVNVAREAGYTEARVISPDGAEVRRVIRAARSQAA